jgi:hypothetical protein
MTGNDGVDRRQPIEEDRRPRPADRATSSRRGATLVESNCVKGDLLFKARVAAC